MSIQETLWHDDFEAEAVMQEEGISWTIAKIPLSEVDWQLTWKNSARLTKRDDETIDNYTIAQKEGDVFPRTIAFKVPTGYIFPGGNHRAQASFNVNPAQSIEAYLVSGLNEQQLNWLAIVLNTRHGKPVGKDELYQIGLARVRQHGEDANDVARKLRISADTLRKRVHSEEERDHLLRLGVPGAIEISQINLMNLRKLTEDPVKTIVAHAAPKLSSDRLSAAVMEINKLPDRADRVAAAKELARQVSQERKPSVNGKKPVKAARKSEFLRSLSAMEKATREPCNTTSLGLSQVEMVEISKRLQSVSEIFLELMK